MAEVILPPEEIEPEIPEEQLPEVEKPTEKSKVISVNFSPLNTKQTANLDTRGSFFTTDTDAWIALKIDDMSEPTGQYSLALMNKQDGSIFQKVGDIVEGVAYYKLLPNEIKHAGRWFGQAVITLPNGQTTASRFIFTVSGHILDGKDVREIVIQDFQTLMKQLNDLKDNSTNEFGLLKSEIEVFQTIAQENENERKSAELERVAAEIRREESYESKVDAAIVEADVVEKVDNKVAELSPAIQEVTAQLAQTANYQTTNFNLLNDSKKERKVIVSFIADDAPKTDLTKLLPIMQEKKIPVGIGIITNRVGKTVDYETTPIEYMTWEEIKYMETQGAEIMGHTHTHPDLRTKTSEEIFGEVSTNKRILSEKGYISDGFIYPFNSYDGKTVKEVKKMFKYSFAARTSNTPRVRNNAINRYNLGAYYDDASLSSKGNPTDSLEYYKERVDYAVENNEWLVFVLHSHLHYLDATQQQHLRDIIDYIRSLGVEIVSPREGFERYGNILEIGGQDTGMTIDASGEMYGASDTETVTIENPDVRKSSDSIANYPIRSVTYTPITPAFAKTDGGFGTTNRGILVTYYLGYQFQFQEYFSIDEVTNNVNLKMSSYKRFWFFANNSWTNWVPENNHVLGAYSSTINANILAKPITDFGLYQVAITPISKVQAAKTGENFPTTEGGVLFTYRLTTDFYQTYQKYESVAISNNIPVRKVHVRYWNVTEWTAWALESTTTTV